jgi:DNA-binding transcriptional LysR family regulator
MHIETLKVFCDLAETRSFTRTAQLNGITQSAVSQLVRTLERAFQARLLERGKRTSGLTREGQVVYEAGKQIVRGYELLHAKMQEVRDIVAGTIRVATIYSIGLHDLPAYIKTFMRLYPTVKVQVQCRHAHQVYEDVLSDTADIGLVACPERHLKLELVPFGQDELALICHPQHPLAQQNGVKLTVLGQQKFVGFEPDLPTRRAVDKILRSRGVAAQYAVEFDNIETVKRAVEIEAGVAIVPRGTVTQEVEKQTLVAVPIEGGPFYRPLGIIYKKKRVLPPPMKQFLAVLKDERD